ncbi:unnamed protein product [Pleuronectes platessa]|uniref:Uncharacterized protein n=1 Tax=Pleuronectes platessa TaxID=8262 RepID=A0A9N7YV39_PLEPL|nr:unnamed protein product [Pleuronectes platessa]
MCESRFQTVPGSAAVTASSVLVPPNRCLNLQLQPREHQGGGTLLLDEEETDPWNHHIDVKRLRGPAGGLLSDQDLSPPGGCESPPAELLPCAQSALTRPSPPSYNTTAVDPPERVLLRLLLLQAGDSILV